MSTTPTIPTVLLNSAALEVNDVADVVITTIQQDELTGDWLREVRIFGEESALLLTVKLRGPTRVSVEITAPESDF